MIIDPKLLVLEFEPNDATLNHKGMSYIEISSANKMIKEIMMTWPIGYCDESLIVRSNRTATDTHRTRMTPAWPLRDETAEDLLEELWDNSLKGKLTPELLNRVRRFLDGKKV